MDANGTKFHLLLSREDWARCSVDGVELRRLWEAAAAPPVRGDGWLDVPRTKALWMDVFEGHKSTIAEGRWIDRPSASLPALYIFTGSVAFVGPVRKYATTTSSNDIRNANSVPTASG